MIDHELLRALSEAIDLADEGWALAPRSYRENERSTERLNQLREILCKKIVTEPE